MKMQQTVADALQHISEEDDSAETKEKAEMLTRLSEPEQMENYLSYGKWDLEGNDIERLQKDDEMRQRVSITIHLSYIFYIIFLQTTKVQKWRMYFYIFTCIKCA